ncbi:hypothetical protein DPMN_188343 [Dreissena polymorpha]|uniref:Uncharacterized protein n=1 Tax=Dreissena polymorpha TaxID=45954 RepID=A0A9D4I9U9_DREPO|nr:hypothetical protein DPMN_188343 [Dreissena polymorpha]
MYGQNLLNLYRIRTRNNDSVAEHFYTNGHSVAEFRVMGLEKLRKFKPYGLNTKD